MKTIVKLFFAVFLLIFPISCKRDKIDLNDQSQVDQLFEENIRLFLSNSHINSVSVAVYKSGKEYIRHGGELIKGQGNNPDNTTLYEIGSASKTFCGLLVARAVLENRLNIDDDVQQYLEEEYPNLSYKGQAITIRHLLTHTSGLPNIIPLEVTGLLRDFTVKSVPARMNEIALNYSREQFLMDLHDIEIKTLPGREYSYSSAGVELLAYILERTYREPYEQLLQAFLLQKTGMRSTTIKVEEGDLPRLAVGYHSDNKEVAPPLMNATWGASGAMKSSVPDIMKYLKFQLSDSSVVAESHKNLFDDDGHKLAYLWNIGEDDDMGKYYFHHGGVFRAQNYIFIYPEHDLGIFIITNQSGGETADHMYEVVENLTWQFI